MDERQLNALSKSIAEQLKQAFSDNKQANTLQAQIDELREELDALKFENESRGEQDALAREWRKYIKDRREEIASLKIIRWISAITSIGLAVAVGVILYIELGRGLPNLKEVGDHATVAFIAGSFLFCLTVLLVLIRGAFGAIRDTDRETPSPEHLKEMLSLLKDLK